MDALDFGTSTCCKTTVAASLSARMVAGLRPLDIATSAHSDPKGPCICMVLTIHTETQK